MINDPTKRHDFMMLIEATDSNPNGDPDAGNLPRIDPETGQGIMTDVSVKRRVRDYAQFAATAADNHDPRMGIYISTGAVLANAHTEAYAETRKTKNKDDSVVGTARRWMCDHYYDVRLFGAVMSLKENNCGQVRGPVQIGFARSIDPIFQHEVTITRVAAANAKEAKATATTATEDTDDAEPKAEKPNQTMGRKSIVPYGLYRLMGTYSPMLGIRDARRSEGTGVDEADLELLWRALTDAWDLDRSASRGSLECRGLHIFTHDSPLGNARRRVLMDRIAIKRQDDVLVPRQFSDYEVVVDADNLPEGVHYTDAIG